MNIKEKLKTKVHYCTSCNRAHGNWLIQKDNKSKVGFSRKCKYRRSYVRNFKNKYKTFEEYLQSPDYLKFFETKKTIEEKKYLKREYDRALRQNMTFEQKERRKQSQKKYLKTAKGKALTKKANAKVFGTISGKLASRIRSQFRSRLKGKVKKVSLKFLDYNMVELKQHLESKFKDGMSWENMGQWHIDHIIPLKYKDSNGLYYWNQEELGDPNSETFKKAWDLNNLQPLWEIDNLSKNCKRIG